MIIDNKGKLFGKINIIDIVVVVIIVMAIGVTYFKFNSSAHSDVTETNSYVEYEVKAKAVRNFSVDAVEIGAKAYDTLNDVYLGEVISVRKEPAFEFITKTDGSIVQAPLPERYDFYITIGANARINNSGIFVDGTKQIINHASLSMATQKSKLNTEIVKVQAKNK